MEKNISKFVGVPYDKMNCWDLAVGFYRDIFDIELKHMYQGPTPEAKETTRNIIYSHIGDFEPALDPRFGDVILIKMFGLESHIAIYLGFGKMLHTSKRTGSLVDRTRPFEKIISGYYRIKRRDDTN